MKKLKKGFSALRHNLASKVGAVSMVAFAGSSHAALTLDSTAILADIATCVGFITVVGLAVLGMIYVAKAIRWARKAG